MEPVAADEVEQRGRHQSASEPAEFKGEGAVRREQGAVFTERDHARKERFDGDAHQGLRRWIGGGRGGAGSHGRH